MTKAKKSHPNIKKTAVSINRTENRNADDIKHSPWLEDYLDLFTFKMKPVTEAFIERLAQELILWVDDEKEARKRLKISQFYGYKKIPKEAFYRWIRKHPNLEEAYKYAMYSLGDRREIGVALREYDASVLKVMPLYDADWKDIEKWRASIKAETEAAASINYIVKNVPIELPNFGPSPLVPERIRD